MKRSILALSLISSVAAADPQLLWSLEGFSHPESVVVIPGKDHYMVSNVHGHPGEKDGIGFISVISQSGQWINKEWATGLDAPKGLAIDGDKVYVSDLTALRIISLETGEILETATHSQAKFLNDVTVDDEGNVYVSDMMDGAIYRYADGQLSRWLSLGDIPHPNGLTYDNGNILLASWGTGMKADFSTETKGGIYTINIAKQTIEPLKGAQDLGNLDSIEKTSTGLITNDWITGDVYTVTQGKSKKIFNAGGTAADMGLDGDKLLVPVMMEDRLDVYSLK